jgi:tRNA pseudouridine38-40 synthase
MRFFLETAYDGTAFHGSQLQQDTPTVQLMVNRSLSILFRQEVVSFGASRTDEGVHALGNFYHFDWPEPLPPNFLYQLNAILPPAISVRNVYQATSDELNARFDAICRRYRYRIYKQKNPFLLKRALHYPFKTDRSMLDATAAMLMQYEDFETFSKRNTQSRTFRCKILQSYWEDQGEELHYIVEANRFLRGMVRGLVGTQLSVARGKNSLEDFRNIIESKDCTRADFSVAGYGLYLEKIIYPQGSLQVLPFERR